MEYFSMSELTRSVTAMRYGISNTPTEEARGNLLALVNNILDPLRKAFGKPIKVTSGYRCTKLNNIVGGAKTSQHLKGEACDITSLDKSLNNKIWELIQKLNLPYDQIIWENGNSENPDWIHVSYSHKRNRKERLRKIGNSYTNF